MASCSRPPSMAAGREPCPYSIRLFGATIPRAADAQKDPSDVVVADEKRSGKSIQCPRCRSQDTKFCYFNNYNVNQPRHFCKACQRYWTAGGALRNVPVGAGRRRAKPPCFGPDRLADGFFFAGSQSEPDRSLGWHAAMAAACDGFQEALKRRRGDPPCTTFD